MFMPELYTTQINRTSGGWDPGNQCFLCEAPLEIIMGSQVDN